MWWAANDVGTLQCTLAPNNMHRRKLELAVEPMPVLLEELVEQTLMTSPWVGANSSCTPAVALAA